MPGKEQLGMRPSFPASMSDEEAPTHVEVKYVQLCARCTPVNARLKCTEEVLVVRVHGRSIQLGFVNWEGVTRAQEAWVYTRHKAVRATWMQLKDEGVFRLQLHRYLVSSMGAELRDLKATVVATKSGFNVQGLLGRERYVVVELSGSNKAFSVFAI